MKERVPLVYFHRMVVGKYLATWPVFIVRDHPESLAFSVAVDDAAHLGLFEAQARERVLAAYRHECALCRLRHEGLLDAAHIIPDVEPDGEPVAALGASSICRATGGPL
jgi:putative restriction endonuclease